MRVAIVHDWLYVVGGAERVLEQLLRIYPGADVFALFDFLPEADRVRLGYAHAQTSFLQRMPFARTRHRSYLPLMPLAIEQFDLSAYDLVISSRVRCRSSCEVATTLQRTSATPLVT